MSSLLDSYFSVIRKLIPTKTEASAVGLDIGSNEVKMVELRKVAEEFQLMNYDVETVKEGNPASAISAVISKCTTPPKNVIASISGKGTLIRYIDLPRMNLDELLASFSIEADKYFPFSQDQIYTDCYILDPNGKGKNMRIMAAAAKKELVDSRLQLLTELGLNTNFIGVNPIALANVWQMCSPHDNKDNIVNAIFDFGDSVSSLTVLVNNIPKFNRDIYIGGRELTKRISNALGVELHEAEALKINPGEKIKAVLEGCDTVLANLMQELRLSFDYFSTENNLTVSNLYITGSATKLEGLEKALAENLEVPTHVWDPFQFIQSDLSDEDKKIYGTKLGVAIGLALYQYD